MEPTNPFWGIHAAVTRQDHDGRPPGGWHPEQAEARVGSLEPGKWADFILVDRDLFAVPLAQLWQLRVPETWVGGERVYAAL